MYNEYKGGILEVIVGPMFSSKTTTLLSRIETKSYTKRKMGVFTLAADTRYSISQVTTHGGKSIPSIAVKESADILRESLENDYEEVFIDEVQFFDDAIVAVIEKLLNQGRRVTVAGLDQDFAGRGFGKMPELLARAEIITKLTAICTICGGAATKSQRLIDGKPAKINDDIMVLGAAESYEARCRVHHVVPE